MTNPRLFSVVMPPLEGEFLYALADDDPFELICGARVMLPFGRRENQGFVISVDSEREQASLKQMEARGIAVKEVRTDKRAHQAFAPDQLQFLEWVAKYYAEPLSKILDLAVPAYAPDRAEVTYALTPQDWSSIRLGAKQTQILSCLQEHGGTLSTSDLKEICEAAPAALRALEEKGLLVKVTSRELLSVSAEEIARKAAPVPLDGEQRAAADRIGTCLDSGTFESFLLHGVTGSGKTEVYLDAIIAALAKGKSALVVVPEIALTPQLTERFERRLGCKVAVLHSSLRPKERWRHWNDLLCGRTRVAIGARSAIFAPSKNLGILVVDEEHDGSFKQGDGIRYHARDLALVRAKLASCPVVLGSATPSLESFHNAKSGRHILLTLPKKFFTGYKLDYKIIDLNGVKPWTMPSKSISAELLRLLKETINRGEQAFILYNRRGFASYFQCNKCEFVVGCPHCSVTLTFHRTPNSLLCHFCGFSTAPPVVCGSCGAAEQIAPAPGENYEPLFTLRGAGTERVFEELSDLMPSARLAKLDRDAVQTVDDYTRVLADVRERRVDILVGTQMIAKGHDLPDVTLVGVVDCDVGLHVPDFRAGERVFHLLTQVSGRAGRRERQGFVVLQTRVPTHPSLKMTVKENFIAFAEQELNARKALGYPPFNRLLRVISACPDRQLARRACEQLGAIAAPLAESMGVTMLGPAPAPIEKVRSHWRHHLLFKASSPAVLQSLMQRLKERINQNKSVRMIFDIDPQDMM